MASIIPGYEYDIFISYRQKDNKHDGWVTEFVDNLKGELESTFKVDISIYFDENPLDGLLETHSVDKSLEGKLKCLIFIPIISQTYCDSKSFAWQHEFCAFNKLAKEDKFGRDIKLAIGNVANRVLPVKIHDLDPEDKILLENEMGGALRCIEFIYKSAGVNRPLRAKEDHPQDNLNKTYFRDQINKVANAVKEIITALKKQSQHPEEVSKDNIETKSSPKKNPKTKIIAGTLILLALMVVGYFIVSKFLNPPEVEKSIAVLPFINDSPEANEENSPFINGLMEEILINLQTIKEFRVLGRTSVEQFRNNTTKSIPEIARELGVNYIVEGSGQKYGNTFRLRVQLIRAKGKEAHLWGKSIEQKIQNTLDIFSVQRQIAQGIASELKATINPEEKRLIERIPTSNLDALYFYQKGNEELSKLIYYLTGRVNAQILINNRQAIERAKKQFNKALEYDSTYALAYVGLANTVSKWDSVLILADKALSYDNRVFGAYILRGNYYRGKGDKIRAFNEYDKALKINPNSWEAYFQKGSFYDIDDDLLKALDNLQKAASLNRGSGLADIKYVIARTYRYAGFYDLSEEIALESLKLDGDSVRYFLNLHACETSLGDIKKANESLKKGYAIDSSNTSILNNLGQSFLWLHKWEESLKYYKKYNAYITITAGHHLVRFGYAYLKNGIEKEAENCFESVMKSCENSIRMGIQTSFTYYLFASVYAVRGEKGKVYENLKQYNQQAQKISDFYLNYLKYDPWFDSMRDEPEFKKIVTEMEEKFKSEHERVKKWLEEKGLL
jgi:TolB-like protein/Tfp pilus assembly protein PilF